MEIRQIIADKEDYLPLLLIGDEQLQQVVQYLEACELFALFDNGLKAVAAVTRENLHTVELKNLAVLPAFQRKGYGRALLQFLFARYTGHTMLVGTGDSPLTVPFYKSCGFQVSHRIPHFFPAHYDHPIWEEGVLLDDMVYFKIDL